MASNQGMYKNRVKNDRMFLKFLLFYLANEGIQSGKIQNNINILNFPASFSAEFTRSKDKRVGISKLFLSYSTLFLYIYPASNAKLFYIPIVAIHWSEISNNSNWDFFTLFVRSPRMIFSLMASKANFCLRSIGSKNCSCC